ncbi:MAG TPA: NADPH-dependent FMN reductase [Candidatus Limnocylindrales bacterium]|nr:NADPH-dependent FMN reductase [Candidatus Limnocylindrales bacterium]
MDATTLNVVGIAGSLRRGSYNRGLIRAAIDLAPAGMRVTTQELDDLPMFNADIEADGDPGPVRRLKDAIGAADALLIATPEYNRCVPGVLKNAIDWASRPARQSVLTNKPVAIMGASTGGGGTARAQAHLRDGLGYTNGLVLPQPEVLVPFAASRFDDAGNLHDDETKDALGELLVALAEWVRQLRQGLARAA